MKYRKLGGDLAKHILSPSTENPGIFIVIEGSVKKSKFPFPESPELDEEGVEMKKMDLIDRKIYEQNFRWLKPGEIFGSLEIINEDP